MRRGSTKGPRAGFTLVEVIAALAIVGLVLANMAIVTRTGSSAARSGVLQASLNDELDLTLDRITLALMGTSEDEIAGPPMAPACSDYVHYTRTLGYEGGVPVTSDPESIVWEPAVGVSGHVVWAVNGGEETEREVTWSRAVPAAFLAEIGSNGEDDNGNGLLDEHGLAFTKEGDRVDIYLTVEKLDENGELAQEAETFTVTCRN
ncbi:MAG: prepilin-type N-terminal cleavage/methylation domain-containing protein [Planctomycetota bacterium]|nr:prepilin-type N-terminal cleavage/methylation domain-containing protein [Planctomycetota bacterium]